MAPVCRHFVPIARHFAAAISRHFRASSEWRDIARGRQNVGQSAFRSSVPVIYRDIILLELLTILLSGDTIRHKNLYWSVDTAPSVLWVIREFCLLKTTTFIWRVQFEFWWIS